MYNILLSVCVLVDAAAWFCPIRIIICKSKNDGVFSRVHTAVRNALNFDAKPPGQIWTISLSSMLTSMEAKESHMCSIFEV